MMRVMRCRRVECIPLPLTKRHNRALCPFGLPVTGVQVSLKATRTRRWSLSEEGKFTHGSESHVHVPEDNGRRNSKQLLVFSKQLKHTQHSNKRVCLKVLAAMSSTVHSLRSRIGDRSTSDVVARLRTPEGRDEWMYCHSHILIEKSKYFADRLSESWPTCQILDSRNCVEVYCQEHDFDYHITVLRLLYVSIGCSVTDMWHGVKNALGILQVAVELGCPEIVAKCVDYLEASPWEEAEEEEILKIIPGMGLIAEPILARLQPVNPTAIVKIFLSATMFATSSPPPTMIDLKTSAQEQIEYMLTEDDDAPLLTADEETKSIVRQYFKGLLARFNDVVNSACETGELHPFQSFLVDMSWACQILTKLEIMKDFVENWIEASEKIVKAVGKMSQHGEMLETGLKVIEVTSKVLEAIGYGNVIMPTAKRLHMVKIWLPFVRVIKPMIDSLATDENECAVIKMDSELWQTLESAFVSIILALPSGEQAGILSEWLENKHIRYPDLTEVFEVWCYRSKVANRRLAHIRGSNGMIKRL